LLTQESLGKGGGEEGANEAKQPSSTLEFALRLHYTGCVTGQEKRGGGLLSWGGEDQCWRSEKEGEEKEDLLEKPLTL